MAAAKQHRDKGREPNMADVAILGAGASGLMCAWQCALRGRRVLVLDHARAPGRKIGISGGGKCNCTNTELTPADYVCANPHFVKSALARYTPWDFLDFMAKHGLGTKDMGKGMIFGTHAPDIARALHAEAEAAGARFAFGRAVRDVKKGKDGFAIKTDERIVHAASVVLALGGPAWPQIGATRSGLHIARSLDLKVTPVRPGLVPLMAPPQLRALCVELSGNTLEVRIAQAQPTQPYPASFEAKGSLLFTHKGISGPAVLDASLFWREGQEIAIDLAPGANLPALLADRPKAAVKTVLGQILPKRLAAWLCATHGFEEPAAAVQGKRLDALDALIHAFPFAPSGTAGFKKAEVTVGGVDTDAISSKTMEARDVPGLYCIGEVLDVAGRLGGYNLHWAWASGHAAGQHA